MAMSYRKSLHHDIAIICFIDASLRVSIYNRSIVTTNINSS